RSKRDWSSDVCSSDLGVVTTAEIMEDFSAENEYFNTFSGTGAAAAAGSTVLTELKDRELLVHSEELGTYVAGRLQQIVDASPRAAAVKGRGLFFGLSLVDESGSPDAELAKKVVEDQIGRASCRERGWISAIGETCEEKRKRRKAR